jgi:hypothetical protein
MANNRGILLIALGNAYYGRLAANLAASLRVTSPDLPIHLVWGQDALSRLTKEELALFHSTQECPKEYCTVKRNGVEKTVYIKPKVHAYDLSPFDETILLDVDTVACPKLTYQSLFDDLAALNLDFTMECRTRMNLREVTDDTYYLWGNPKELMAAHGLTEGWLYGLHSEFIYWKRGAVAAKLFKEAVKAFNNPKVKTTVFNGDIPDEIAFAVAMIKCSVYPHQVPYKPIYWFLTDNKSGSSLRYVHEKHYGYSVGGNATPEGVVRNYNRMASAYYGRLGMRHPYRLQQKRVVIPLRKVM